MDFNYRNIPTCESLQALALENSLPDGLYLTRIHASVRKVCVVNGIVSLYGGKNNFVNRFSQSHFFAANVIISKLNNKKWKRKNRILKAGDDILQKYSIKDTTNK